MSDLPDWTRGVAVEVNAEAPTEYWLAKNGTRIAKHGNAKDSTTTLYTVPEDSELYILHAGLNMRAGAASAEAYLYENNAVKRYILWGWLNANLEKAELVTKCFYRAVAGEGIKLYANANASAEGYFVGYLMEGG